MRGRAVWSVVLLAAAIALAAGVLLRGSGNRAPVAVEHADGYPSGAVTSGQAGRAPSCGDGRFDPGEHCELGETIDCARLVPHATTGRTDCTPECLWDVAACRAATAECGNGVVEAGELCDDGNRINADGCDARCVVEVHGRAIHYDGPEVDTRIERALAQSSCRDPATREGARRGPRQRVEYTLLVCQLPNGEPVFPVDRIRAALATVQRELRPAGIDLVEDRRDTFTTASDCRVPFGASELRELATEARERQTLPLFFVRGIRGSEVPGMNAAGFAAFGYGGVLGTTDAEIITHELGHAFGLLHTHACLSGSDACSRSGDGICDTPFDPGPQWLPHRCGDRSAEACSPGCQASLCSGGAQPDRANHMSYFSGCRTDFSVDQLDLMRCVLDHELSWLQAADGCGSELCNRRDDDCDGQVDEAPACEAVCEPYEDLSLGRVAGHTRGRTESFGGELYPEGTPDVLYRFDPERAGAYCLEATHDGRDSAALGPILAWRDGCSWRSGLSAINLDPIGPELHSTLEVRAGPGEPAWISVDGWGRSDGIGYRIDVRAGSCRAQSRLTAPRLLEPRDGARPRADAIALRWEPVDGAEAYELRLAADVTEIRADPPCARCDAQIVDVPAVDLGGIAVDQRVFWTVRALRGDRSGPFAAPRSLTAARPADLPPLGQPRLRHPERDALLHSLTESFGWDPVEGATHYELRLGLDPASLSDDACQDCLSERVEIPAYQPSPRLMGPDIEYAWTVRAGRAREWGAFAPTRGFQIDNWRCTQVGRLDIPGSRAQRMVPFADGLFEASCGGDSSGEHVWLLVPERDGRVCIDTELSEIDTVVSVRHRCEVAETEVACNDEGFPGRPGPSRVEVEAAAEVPLFVIVESYDWEEVGEYTLRVAAGPCE